MVERIVTIELDDCRPTVMIIKRKKKGRRKGPNAHLSTVSRVANPGKNKKEHLLRAKLLSVRNAILIRRRTERERGKEGKRERELPTSPTSFFPFTLIYFILVPLLRALWTTRSIRLFVSLFTMVTE